MAARLDLFATPGVAVNAASGAFLIVLGIAVALLRPWTRVTVALAMFSGCLGATFVVVNLYGGASGTAPEDISRLQLGNVFRLIAVAAVVFLSLRFPTPIRRGELRILLVSLLLGVFVGLANAIVNQSRFNGLWNSVLMAAFWFTLFLLAFRYSFSASPRQERQYVLMTLALLVYPAAHAGEIALATGLSPLRFAGLLACALLSGLWLATPRVGKPPPTARNVALATLGVAFAAVTYAAAFGGFIQVDQQSGLPGVARTVTVFLLAYAILRGQLLDIDVKVKWTLKRGTLAAIFVGVFFIVSQIAQNYFAQYGVLAGGIAAGLLLFGLSPLQRLAERVADTAMPGVKSSSEMTHPERVAVYRAQIQAAWEDGHITRDERRLLDKLRENLGISRDEASRLESEAASLSA